jgi:hypothetical protein
VSQLRVDQALWIGRGDDKAFDGLEEVFRPTAIGTLQCFHVVPALKAVRQDITSEPAQIPEAQTLRLGYPVHECAK